MITPVVIGNLGEGVEVAVFADWIRAEGESVVAGEAIAEVMTDKVNLEIEAPTAGILSNLACQAEDDVRIGQVIAEILG